VTNAGVRGGGAPFPQQAGKSPVAQRMQQNPGDRVRGVRAARGTVRRSHCNAMRHATPPIIHGVRRRY
jgi:hypothetical protein